MKNAVDGPVTLHPVQRGPQPFDRMHVTLAKW